MVSPNPDDDQILAQKGLALIQQQVRLSAKVAPLVMATALLQEAMSLNQQAIGQVKELTDRLNRANADLKNERQSKISDPDGGKV